MDDLLKAAKQKLSYLPDKGIFVRTASANRWKSGTVAGSIDSKGYVQIKINGKLVLAHRLAWAFVYGDFPKGSLDHIDRNPLNNRIENLRVCTMSQNQQNVGIRVNNTSGITGVALIKKSQKWLAYINLNGKRYRLGLFERKNDAIKARLQGEQHYHTFLDEQGVEVDVPEQEIA